MCGILEIFKWTKSDNTGPLDIGKVSRNVGQISQTFSVGCQEDSTQFLEYCLQFLDAEFSSSTTLTTVESETLPTRRFCNTTQRKQNTLTYSLKVYLSYKKVQQPLDTRGVVSQFSKKSGKCHC